MRVVPLPTPIKFVAPETELSVMPLLEFNVMSAVVTRAAEPFVAGLKFRKFAVAEPGAVPRLPSLLIDNVPALIVVVPVYVFAPDSVILPEPILVSEFDELVEVLAESSPSVITPETVNDRFEPPIVTEPVLVSEPFLT